MESVGSTICYWIIALAIVIFSVLTVTTRKILRAATYLLFVLFATAALYFKLDYEFLGAVQIAVYAGGIVVLFVFAILLTTHPGDNSEQLASRKKLLVWSALSEPPAHVAGRFAHAVPTSSSPSLQCQIPPCTASVRQCSEQATNSIFSLRGCQCVITRMYNRWRGNRP